MTDEVAIDRSESWLSWMKNVPYPPLPNKTNHVRLLELELGTQTSEVRCQLKAVRFEDAPPYEAISYHWGAAFPTGTIVIQDRKCEVPLNLFSFLRHRQAERQQMPIWIDALCINQRDNEEKGLQIMLMPEIYGKCTWLTIWLGPSVPKSAYAMKRVQELSRADASIWVSQLSDGDYAAISDLLKRSWWSRVWIVQEVGWGVSGPRLLKARFMCGTDSVTWQELVSVVESLDRRRCSYDLNVNVRDRVLDLASLGERLLAEAQKNRPRLFELIYALRSLAAPSKFDPLVTPNYRISAETLFKRFVSYEIQDSRKLDILRYGGIYGYEKNSISWVPDWSDLHKSAPFTPPRKERPYACFVSQPTDATFSGDLRSISVSGLIFDQIERSFFLGSPRPTVEVGEQLSKSFLAQVFLARKYVISILQPRASPQERLELQKKFWQALLIGRFDYNGPEVGNLWNGDPLNDFVKWLPDYSRTSVPSTGPKEQHVDPAQAGSLYKWRRESEDATDPNLNAGDIAAFLGTAINPFYAEEPGSLTTAYLKSDIAQDIADHLDRMAFFITKKGFMGIRRRTDEPWNVKHGQPPKQPEYVAVLQGGSVPFILIPVGKNFRLLGEAYVHELMYTDTLEKIFQIDRNGGQKKLQVLNLV